MNRRGLPLVGCIACAALCLSAGGCLMMADSNTTVEGASQAVDAATLAKIETGKTTRQWVIATLGEPTSASKADEETEVLRYDCTKRVHNSATFFVLFAANDNKESRQSVFLEIRDGVVAKHWTTTWPKAG